MDHAVLHVDDALAFLWFGFLQCFFGVSLVEILHCQRLSQFPECRPPWAICQSKLERLQVRRRQGTAVRTL